MKLLGLLVDKAPNRVFLSIILGVLAGATYALIIPLVLNGLAPEDGSFPTVGSESAFLFGWQISHFKFAASFVLACLLILAARTASQVILTRVSMDATSDLRTTLYRRISNAPIADLERVGMPRLIASITSDVPALIAGARLLPDLLTSCVTLVGMLGYVYYLNSAVFRFVMLCIFFGALTYQAPMLLGRRYLIRARRNLDGLHEAIRGLVHGAKELKLNSDKREDYFHNVIAAHEHAVRDAGKTGNTIIRVTQNYGDLISFFVIGAVSFVFANYHAITPQEMNGVIMVLLYVTGPIAVLLNFVPQLVTARVALRRVNELFGQIKHEPVETQCAARRDWQTLRFDEVCYQYEGRKGDAGFRVGPLNLTVRKGEITFIVGGNGSGKSTLSKLLTLHYSPSAGAIRFDDETVDTDNLAGFRRGIAAIYSDYYLFDRALGLDGRDVQADVDAYLKALELDSKVSFENGRFSTLSLSDGQRRRLALVAAYLEDAELYLFDEWAADQDPSFKLVFYNRILPELKAKGKAVIVISHDDRYFNVADRLIVMSEGRIASDGSAALAATAPAEPLLLRTGGADYAQPSQLDEAVERTPCFPDIMRERARLQPQRVACRFFSGASLVPQTLTFGELWQQAAALAQVLRTQGLAGQRALLVCKSQQQFVVAFYACLLGGVVAVPSVVPKRRNLLERLQLIADDAQACAVLFDGDEIAEWTAAGEGLLRFDLRQLSQQGVAVAAAAALPPIDEHAPAFLQYTSGSTGDPKGVVVSHGNLVRNCAVIAEAMEISSSSSLFTALPLFHDMGLVGGVLQLMYSGCVAGFLSPAEFVQYPERWLQIIAKFGVNVSGGPNFMFDLAARAIKDSDLDGIDLSGWRVAFCGAEPIRAATIARFSERFASLGFRAEAFYPCYGMAESTLFITGAQAGTPVRISRRDSVDVVGCGAPRLDTTVEIVDPQTLLRLGEGETGEIWVGGGSVAQGYWRRPELSQQTFRAQIADGDGTAYLRTGDLGFLQDGQLYVTGRLKDLIIVNGRKYSPQDIEHECELAHDALRQAGGAAFGVTSGEVERLVVVFELKRDWLRREEEWPSIRSAVRTRISDQFGVPVADVVLIRPGALPRTSSGKVRRSQCSRDYIDGVLDNVASGVSA